VVRIYSLLTSKQTTLFRKARKSNIMKSIQKEVKVTKVNYEQIENTPFTIVEKNKEFYILIGDTAAIEDKFSTKAAAKQYINKRNWKLIMNTICIIADKINKYNNEKTKQKDHLETM